MAKRKTKEIKALEQELSVLLADMQERYGQDAYTIVGIHDSGLGWILHIEAGSAKEALQKFRDMNQGCALGVFKGRLINRVQLNLWPGSPTIVEDDNNGDGQRQSI